MTGMELIVPAVLTLALCLAIRAVLTIRKRRADALKRQRADEDQRAATAEERRLVHEASRAEAIRTRQVPGTAPTPEEQMIATQQQWAQLTGQPLPAHTLRPSKPVRAENASRMNRHRQTQRTLESIGNSEWASHPWPFAGLTEYELAYAWSLIQDRRRAAGEPATTDTQADRAWRKYQQQDRARARRQAAATPAVRSRTSGRDEDDARRRRNDESISRGAAEITRSAISTTTTSGFY